MIKKRIAFGIWLVCLTLTFACTNNTPTSIQPVISNQVEVKSLVINQATGGEVRLSDNTRVDIPPETFSQSTTVTITKEIPSSGPPVDSGLISMGYFYTYDDDNNPSTSNVVMVLVYSVGDIPSGYTEADLEAAYFDGGKWNVISATQDTTAKTLTVVTDHFAIWGVFCKRHATPTPSPTFTNITTVGSSTPTFTLTATFTMTSTPTLTPTGNITSTPTLAVSPTNTPTGPHPFIQQWGSSGYSSSGGYFRNPTAITGDSFNELFIMDLNNYIVQKYSTGGNYISQIGTYGSGEFSIGSGLAQGSTFLYASDFQFDRVRKYDLNGNLIKSWNSYVVGGTTYYFWYLGDIALDPSGNVYVCDSGHNQVIKFDGNGNFISYFALPGTGDGQVSSPTHIAIDVNGNVYIGDGGNARIQKFTPGGSYSLKWTVSVYNVALYGTQKLYVFGGKIIYEYDLNGNLLSQWVIPQGVGPGEIGSEVRGLWADPNGNVYLSDTMNNRIEEFGP